MAITRDRLGRFSSNGGGKGPQSTRKERKDWSGKTSRTLEGRMKNRLQGIQSKQVSKVIMGGKRGSMKLADRIMAAQRNAKKS